MRDLSKLLWCDLVTDEERIEFIESGRAYETGIIAPAIEAEIIKAYNTKCICDGSWRAIVAEVLPLIGKKFRDCHGNEYLFFGIVYGDGDYYYGMYDKDNRCVLLSCVGSLEEHGYTLVTKED